MRLKRYSFLLIFVFLLFSNILFAQAFDQPESAVYDTVNDRYLVSNMGNGDIISVPRTNPNNLSYFSTGIVSSVRGITIDGNTLWAATTANNGTDQILYEFDVNTGQAISGSIWITEGSFINDVTADGSGMVYLSDNNNIYAINTTTGGYSTLLANAGANGLLYDGLNNRLLYTDDTDLNTSRISVIDLATNTSSVLITNQDFQWLDGLTVDHLGNYYVSCWSNPYAIYRYDPNFTASTLASNHNNNGGAADIFYDAVNNVMVVPNMDANTVQFIPFANLSSEDEIASIPSNISLNQNFPNPFNPNTSISYDISNESLVKLTVYDLRGSEVAQLVNQIEQPGSKVVQWEGRNQRGELVNGGVYLYKLEIGDYVETRKMVLLK